MISLEEALGIAITKTTPPDASDADLKRLARKRRVLEIRVGIGATHEKICEIMREEGWKIGERVIFDDLHSATAEEFRRELERQQYRDIALANQQKDLDTAMHYRDRQIERLTPRRIELKGEYTETHIDIQARVNELIKISREPECSNSEYPA